MGVQANVWAPIPYVPETCHPLEDEVCEPVEIFTVFGVTYTDETLFMIGFLFGLIFLGWVAFRASTDPKGPGR